MSEAKQIFAKQLRRNMTDAEKLLWHHLRGHRFLGVKFKRQQPLGNYIVDFVSFEQRIVIEVDGSQHLESESDKQRDDWLQRQGYRTLRFWNNEVLGETESVLEKIFQYVTPADGATSHLTNPAKDAGQAIAYPQSLSHQGRGEVESALSDHTLSPRGRGGKVMERVRWRCRRGLLELDIVLGRFIEKDYPDLDEGQRLAFDVLLDMPDNELWDMIAGRMPVPVEGAQRAVLKMLQAA